MKFMKLGSKTDAFQSNGSDIRYVASELATDVIVHVGEVKFYLHKFPLLSKSGKLQKLVLKATEDGTDELYIHDFPGGPKSFEICAKFCYGMIVTLNPYNVVSARCAAEYLEMTEQVEKGNLIFKIEVFLNSSILRSWKDSIIVLQTTKVLLPWSEELKVVGRCIDSIASKTSVEPENVNWSYSYNKKFSSSSEIVETPQRPQIAPKDWWIEDLCELDVDLYKRVMVSIKSKGTMSSDLIGEALRAYAMRWIPDSYDALVADDYMKRNKALIETIIRLLPSDKGPAGCSCRFLLKLLKAAILVGVGENLKDELMNRISLQLHKASVKDILIPARSSGNDDYTTYDVELVLSLVNRFLKGIGEISNGDDFVERSEKGGMIELNLERDSLLGLGELVDGYLCEVASDLNLSLDNLVELATAVPETARPVHDGLYTAIDIYLKVHPDLMKFEKKKLCGLMDVKKLSAEAAAHAAQNERLPLRVVVQVLFFEQLRTNSNSSSSKMENTEQESSKIVNLSERKVITENAQIVDSPKSQLGSARIKEERSKSRNSFNYRADRLLLPSRSKRILDKLWIGKGQAVNGKSSETSGSSQSPPVLVKHGESKSSVSSRNRRFSVS